VGEGESVFVALGGIAATVMLANIVDVGRRNIVGGSKVGWTVLGAKLQLAKGTTKTMQTTNHREIFKAGRLSEPFMCGWVETSKFTMRYE
jgi:hypothetical protein